MKLTHSQAIENQLSRIPSNIQSRFLNTFIGSSEPEDFRSDLLKMRHFQNEKPIIYIGTGTCGLAAGAKKTINKIKSLIEEKNLDVSIIEVGCIGLCSEEPIVDIKLPKKNRLSFKKVDAKAAEKLINFIEEEMIPVDQLIGQFMTDGQLAWDNIPTISEHPFFSLQERTVLEHCGINNPTDINAYIASGGYFSFLETIHQKTPFEVADIVEESGLRGRGGGGFPTGKKWKFALGADSDQKYFICNADEGDPGAFMDRAVIEGDPHKLIEGLLIASYAIGASKAYVYIRAEYPIAIKNLDLAIKQAKEYGLLGEDIYESGFSLDIIVKTGAGAFVCGEETALIHSVEGKRGMPRPRPPFPAEKGLFGKPTIINNVETLANVPSILSLGADWFSRKGTEGSKGTKVFALSGKVKRAGLVEIPMGMPLRDVIFKIGGGIENDAEFKAVQMGGPSGGCIPTEHLDVPIEYETLKEVGAMIGSGGMVVMDEHTCMVDVATFFMDFIQRESCGKCIPCREGTRSMLETLQSISQGRFSSEKVEAPLDRFKMIMNLESLAETIGETSLCGLGQTAPSPVLSTLRWFRDEYEDHVYERKCRAKVCKELLTYTILEEECVGCTICSKKCPVGAIEGGKKEPHKIIQEKCVSCGACYDACNFSAVKMD